MTDQLAIQKKEAPMAQLTLSGKIRDFKDSHADFEHVIAPEKNIVEPVLGQDRKPVYNGGNGETTTGKQNFDQWFRDIKDVNLSKRLDIVLKDEDSNGVFTFEDQKFFPIDNELFGNEGRNHNYHFTYEIHSAFTYKGTEKFTFSGDDDLWVFIDGKLVIDLGGVHGALTETIDLTLPDGVNQLDKVLPSGKTLMLEKGKCYSFDLFFAERHTTQSHFRIDTSLLLKVLPMANLLVKDAVAKEYPKDTGAFVIELDKPTDTDITVQYGVSGTATQGTDYKTLRIANILAGKKSIVIPVEPILDELEEGTETVVLTLLPGEGYDVGDTTTGTVNIADFVLPTPVICIKSPDPKAAEPPKGEVCIDTGKFLICAEKPVVKDTVITYTVSGTATEGKDYKSINRSVTLSKGETEVCIEVIPLADAVACEADETVVVTLQPGAGYKLGDCCVAKVAIAESSPKQLNYLLICLILVFLTICGFWFFLHSAA